MGFKPLRALQQLPHDEENRIEDDHSVVLEEDADIPRPKARVTIEEDNKKHPSEINICAPRLVPREVRQLASFDPLHEAGSVEADICGRDHNVIHHATGGDQTDKPVQNLRGGATDLHERKQGENSHHHASVDWCTVARRFRKDPMCSAFQN